jgi:hypothetical protein
MRKPMTELRVHLRTQRLELVEHGEVVASYAVSTAANGPGERRDSGCTPTGRHRIRLCIGGGCPENAVFAGRRHTGELYSPALAAAHPGRDWILTRILWLTGAEPGRNRGGARDTLRRFIYIHGTPDGEPMGEPRSHGCIRMRNRDIIALFDRVSAGTPVSID